jgi:hypothetical protein
VVHAYPELPRVGVLGIARGRREHFVDHDVEFGQVRGPELRRGHRDPLEHPLPRLERERIQRLLPQRDQHLLLGESALRLVDLEIEGAVLLRIPELHHGVLLRPLPLNHRIAVGDFRRVPP